MCMYSRSAVFVNLSSCPSVSMCTSPNSSNIRCRQSLASARFTNGSCMVLSDTGHIPPGSCATASALLSDSRETLHSDGSERIDMDQYIQTRFLTGLIYCLQIGVHSIRTLQGVVFNYNSRNTQISIATSVGLVTRKHTDTS